MRVPRRMYPNQCQKPGKSPEALGSLGIDWIHNGDVRRGGGAVGIPGLRGGDHVGFTVPDMEQAHEFLVDVLGCEYVYSLPEMRHGDDWMAEHLNVDPRAVVREIRFYRCGFGLNFEVFEYEPLPGQRAV